MDQVLNSKNVNNNVSTTLNVQESLRLDLVQTNVWTGLFEKLNLRESRSIWITQLTDSNNYQLALRCADGLRVFQYSSTGSTWQEIMYSKEFCDQNGFNKACYSLQFWKIPQFKKEILICRTQNGFFFGDYDPTKHELRPLAQDILFPDSSRWYDEHNQLQWGSFYGSDAPLGLFTRHIEQGIRFYILNPNGFQRNNRPIWEDTNTNQHIKSLWHAKDDHFEFADILGNGMTNIIRRNDHGLSIYGFQTSKEGFFLKELFKTDLCNKESGWQPGRDKLWFVRLTKNRFSNLVVLQTDGLKVYDYVEEKHSFICLNHETSMSMRFGWKQEHSDSLLFADITGNGLMQLIYTGPQGLTISSFNSDTRQWKINLNSNELNFTNKYAVSCLFISSKQSPTQSSVLITKHLDKLNCFNIEKKILQSKPIERLSNNQEIKKVKSRFIPPQCEPNIRSRSIAYLRDTLDIKPLLSAVDTFTGKLDFTLPLINFFTGSNGLQIQLALRYQGINQCTSFLGIGWNLVEDYIAVDYQNSIDPLVHRYYWTTSHGIVPLIRQNSSKFRLATSYDLYFTTNFNENLFSHQDNVVVIIGPEENQYYYSYCRQNGRWQRNTDDNQLKKILIKNLDLHKLGQTDSNGLIQITNENFKSIIQIIKTAISNENYFDMNITYDQDRECWLLETSNGEKRMYNNVVWTVGWENWLGLGNETKHQKQYPVRWHLKEIHGEQHEQIIYEYENIEYPIGNQSFTRSIYLKSISDNYKNKIEFIYKNKSSEEYEEPILNDENGYFILSPTFARYLKTIHITTRVNIQTIQFEYQIRHQIRYFISLSQLDDIHSQPILKFSYQRYHQSRQINQIDLPNGEQLSLTYQLNQLKHLGHDFDSCQGEYIVQQQAQLTTGSDYILLSDIHKQTLSFKLLPTEKTPQIDFPEIADVCTYRVFARQDYLGFIVQHIDKTFALYLHHRNSSNQWLIQSKKKCSLADFRMYSVGQILIIINPCQEILLIDWNVEQEIWTEEILPRPSNVSLNSEIFLATNQSLIVISDDQHLWIAYQHHRNHWQTKYLRKISNYFFKSKQTLNKFQIHSTLYENLLLAFKSQMIQIHQNMICLFSWQEYQNQLQSIISLFTFDSNYNIRSEQIDVQVYQESFEEIFSEFQEEEFFKDEKIRFRLTYEKSSNEKYRVVFERQQIEMKNVQYIRLYEFNHQQITVTLQGKKGCVIYNKHTGKYFTEMTENLQSEEKSFGEFFQEIFLVDLMKYFPQFHQNEIQWKSNKWIFDGYQWKINVIHQTKSIYPLGKDYILSQENPETSFKLYQQDSKGQSTGNYLFDFNVLSLGKICNCYPNYIAYQENDNRIFVLPFKKKSLGDVYYLTDGYLTPWSNLQLLVISQSKIEENQNIKWMIYSNLNRSKSYEDPVIIQMNSMERNTGYFYHEQSANLINGIVIYSQTEIIPGNDKSHHGWIEINCNSLNNHRKYFNSIGEEISPPIQNSSNSKDECQSLSNRKRTLFLNGTTFELAQFSYSNIEDDEGSYFGFESYEIDQSSSWHYPHENLIRNTWSLTGEYCLQLKNKTQSIHRRFRPKNQFCSYRSACWIRGSKSTKDFQAIIKTNQDDFIGILSANLLCSRDEWSYFEINIDLPEMRNNGGLTPIYSMNINKKIHHFQQEINSIENQSNFDLLQISSKTTIEQILGDGNQRSLISSDMKKAFFQNNFPEEMKKKMIYQNLEKKYKEHQEKIIEYIENLHLPTLDFNEIVEHQSNFQQLKLLSNQIEFEFENYFNNEDILKDFISTSHLFHTLNDQIQISSTFKAFIQFNHIRFYIWKSNSNNELILIQTNQNEQIKPKQTIHFLYEEKSQEFTKLIDVTNKCLSNEKRQLLKQGHTHLIIDLIIQPIDDYILDIDHIRFHRCYEHFYARVYHPLTYQVTALIDGNGSIKYMFYNHRYEPFAVTDWKKYLTELCFYGRRGMIGKYGSILARKQPENQMKIKPFHGFYEDFSKISFEERWLIHTNDHWKRIQGCLMHTTNTKDCLNLENQWFDEYSAGFYVQFDLQLNAKIEIEIHKHLITIECLQRKETNLIVNNEIIHSIPSRAEYLIISEANRLWLWINGQLQIDKSFHTSTKNSNHLLFNITGNVSLSQLFIFSKPSIDVIYKNSFNEELQTIQLETFQSAIVSQILYDDLGRKRIITKPTQIFVHDDQPLLAFQENFIDENLTGTVNQFNPKDNGYCYSEIQYADYPFEKKLATGQPGCLFSINNIGCLKYTRDAQSDFINLVFPGYSIQVTIQSHGRKQINVSDSHGNQIASYVTNNLLTTYEYDDENRLIQVLPPTYHVHPEIDTLSQVIPYSKLIQQWQTNEYQRNIQKNYSTRMMYDINGQMIERISPDTSRQILIYSQEKLLRFILQHNRYGQPCRVIYYQYDRFGDLSSQGYSSQCLTREQLQNLANNYSELPQAIPYLQTIKNNSSIDANLRSRTITSVINHSEGVWRESSTYIHEGKLSNKEIRIFSENTWQIYRTDYCYCGDYLASMTYPMLFQNQPFTITYSYNKQNRIIAIGIPENIEQWAKFTYTAHGQISDEKHMSNHFMTHYDYNSPGYLENIQNSYLKETISYTEGSYGQSGFFDGTIARTQFKAQWFNRCDTRLLSLTAQNFQERLHVIGHDITLEKAEYYLQVLQMTGFLDGNRRVMKTFLPRDAALYLPRECGGTLVYALAEILNEYFTENYGHQYSYGKHMELTKAKYTIGEQSLKPIQPMSFESNQISSAQSKSIWQILVNEIYIWPDNDDGIHLQGKVNTNKWIDYETLKKNLGRFADYDHLLATVLQTSIVQREILTWEKFQKIFLTWLTVSQDTQQKSIDIYLETAKQIWTILSNQGYLYSTTGLNTLFTKHFYQILQDYQKFIPEIVGALQKYASCQTGESACDVEAYMIDENGNHRHYWTGYSRYVLHYKENNNQIENIDYRSMSRDKPARNFQMTHDALGNVTKAEHKGITEIIYHPTSNRPIIIKLQNGHEVSYDYDVRGERVRKYIKNNKGEQVKEVLYIRDEEGRSLVEKVIDFTGTGRDEQLTGYIYGPRGLIGFIRNDEFYSVVCDHEGSIRLIIKNEEVVAAYDYLPYGNLIRHYGIPQVQIPYRYTGQEWDEETGLYNYHARLYDPDIGRFYQIDPQEQYASPYKYAGNSPVSMIDPSGEIAFVPIIIIGLAVGGAYLGGSAANNNWNPLEWDFSKASTYFGFIGGGLAGALAPLGFTLSLGALVGLGFSALAAIATVGTLGLVGAYLGMASGNQNWDPTQWQWSRPMTWNSAFQGFIFGSSVVGGIGAWHNFYISLGSIGQKLAFVIGSGALALGMGYLSGAAANGSFNVSKWNLKSPTTVFAVFGGAFGGFMAPLAVAYSGNFILSFQTTGARVLIGCGTFLSGGTFVYLFGSAANNSFTHWDMSSPKTYEAMIGGFLFGISLPALPRALKDAVRNISDTWKRIERNEYFRQEKYKVDQQLANEIHDAVKSVFEGNVQGVTKPSKDGVISITTTADGKKFFAYSGSEKNAVVYGVVDNNGTITVHIENVAPGIKDGKVFTFEIVENKLNITKQQVWEESGMPKQRGQDFPRAPEICGEPRAMTLAFEAGYAKNDILSCSAFKRASTGVTPINACPNCAVYVPGKILTESQFYFATPHRTTFDHMIFAAFNSLQQFQRYNTMKIEHLENP